MCEKWDNNTIVPLYDNEDSVCGILYNDEPFYFQKNLQGDVVAIFNKNVETVARYSYDAWGVCTVTQDASDCAIATVNPYRYRGYYYDPEIGMYYLQSRYYDPVVGRFVNGDKAEIVLLDDEDRSANSVNLFAYCFNEPVMRCDEEGMTPGYTSSGYIDDQLDPVWKKYRMGFLGNVFDNGCGPIAIYNILHSYSKKITFKKVMSDLRWLYGSVIYNNIALIGITPFSITRCLASKFWFRYTAGPITYLWGIKAELSSSVLVFYQHSGWKSPFHYVAGIKVGDGVGGSFIFYNDGDRTNQYEPISIWKYLDRLKKDGCKPLYMWGVAGKKGWW